MFAVAFKAYTECSYIEQVTVKWVDAHSQAPAWHLPAQVLEVGSTGQVCAAQSAGAAHTGPSLGHCPASAHCPCNSHPWSA